MKNYNNYVDSLNEKIKWYWWFLLGSIALNQYFKYKNTQYTSSFKNLKYEKNLTYEWIDIARNKVKDKVKKSNIENKDFILQKIDSCKIIKLPNKLKNVENKLSNVEGAYTRYDGIDYVFIDKLITDNDDNKIRTLTHELFHLVDHYRKKEELSKIKINKNLSEYDYSYILFEILDNHMEGISKKDLKKTFDDMDFNDEYLEYVSGDDEIYARLNNLKIYLYDNSYIKSPNDNIPEYIFKSFFNGRFFKHLNDDEKKIFINSDFLEILPFLKNTNLKDLNKIAYLDNGNNDYYFQT